ncbi:MAG: site-specific integrase [Firmicutes bacterium]|nr:site-specific integrase [Bacillota bacterium]
MATIQKRKNSFQIIVSLGYDSSGKQIRKTTTFKPPEGTTPKKAEKMAAAFASDFEKKCQGLSALNENMRFSDLVEKYFELYAPTLKEVTAYTYKGQIERHLLPAFGNTKLKDFSTAKLSAFFKDIDLQPSSCRKLLVILKSVFSFAVKQGIIEKSPCTNVILPKANNVDDDTPVMTELQIKELISMLKADDVKESQFSAIIMTLLYTGMRSGECLGLQWADVDFDNNLIHIRHSCADCGGKHWLDAPKTKNSIRTIGVSEELKQILLAHKASQQNIALKVGKGYNPLNLVFTSATGTFKDRSQLLYEFKRFIKGKDFENISLHSLRHANATLLIMNGIDIKLVSAHLGHSSIAITGDMYADVLEKSKRQMADLISLSLNS